MYGTMKMNAVRNRIRKANEAVAANPESFLRHLLPNGRQRGREWVAINPRRVDGRLGSFKVNMKSGKWADFARDDRGGDFVSLCAYIKGIKQGEAAREIINQFGGL